MIKISFIRWVFLLTITWIILNGIFNWFILLSGIVVSIIILKFTEKYLLGSPYHQVYHFKLIKILKFFFFMIKEIYASGFQMIGMILSNNINPAIVEIETDLEEEYKRILLANSITLTPGTITADLTEHKLKVLWIKKTSEDPNQIREAISKSIEERLRTL